MKPHSQEQIRALHEAVKNIQQLILDGHNFLDALDLECDLDKLSIQEIEFIKKRVFYKFPEQKQQI